MSNFGRFVSLRFAKGWTLAFGVLVIAGLPLFGLTQSFNVPDDVALRIRLDDTLTSVDSEVGDPFSATVANPASAEVATELEFHEKSACFPVRFPLTRNLATC